MSETQENSVEIVRAENKRHISAVFSDLMGQLRQTENEQGISLFAQLPLSLLDRDGNQLDLYASVRTDLYSDAKFQLCNFRLNITKDYIPVENFASLSILPNEIAKISGGLQKKNKSTIETAPYLDVDKAYSRLGIGSSLLQIASEGFIGVIASKLKEQYGFSTLIKTVSDTSFGPDSMWSTAQAKKLGYTPERFLLLFPVPNGAGRTRYIKRERID